MTDRIDENADWAIVRPGADFYNYMIERLEIRGVKAQNLWNLDNLTSINPDTTFGIIICYEDTKKWKYHSNKDILNKNVFFARQPQDHASPTMALVNILCNFYIDKGPILHNILNDYSDTHPPHNGLMAHSDREIREIHNNYQNNEEPETAENGEPKIQSVVSYIHKYGYTWRFNSERGSALKLGINGNWLYLLQAFLQRKKEKIVNIVAIVEDPLSKQALRLATSPVDDSPLLEEEEPMVENSANESMHEADLDSETLRLINDPNRQQNTSWHRKGRKINPTTGKTIRKSTRSKPIVKDKVAKGRVTKAKRDPKTTNNGPKKSTTTRENGTAVSKKSATFQKNGTTSSKNSTTSSKNDKASEKNGTTSSKNDEASGKKGAESTKNDKASGKKDTKSSKKVKTGGVASCSKKRGQKRSRDDEDDDAENKRYRNARNSYNLRS